MPTTYGRFTGCTALWAARDYRAARDHRVARDLRAVRKLQVMNDSRFSHFYSHTFPQVDTCTEMEVMNGSFITCHSCQANRSQPPTVHILQKCPSACGRAQHGPACGRAQRELGMRPTCGWTRRELDTWPPPQRQNRATKKGRTGDPPPVRPRRARFLAVATLGKTSRLDRAGPLQPTRPLGPMRCCNRGLNPCGQRNRRADQLPTPL